MSSGGTLEPFAGEILQQLKDPHELANSRRSKTRTLPSGGMEPGGYAERLSVEEHFHPAIAIKMRHQRTLLAYERTYSGDIYRLISVDVAGAANLGGLEDHPGWGPALLSIDKSRLRRE